MALEIEYEPQVHELMIDQEVQLILNRFPAVGAPPARPDIGCKLEFGDGAWRAVFYTEGDTIRFELRYADLTDAGSEAQRQTAHLRATELLNVLAPRYFSQPCNLAFDEGDNAITLSFR